MTKTRSVALASAIVATTWFAHQAPVQSQGHMRALLIKPGDGGEVAAWDRTVDRMVRSKELLGHGEQPDPLLPGRAIERFDQYYDGVRIWGANVVRQLDRSSTVSIFGTIYSDITIDAAPAIDA